MPSIPPKPPKLRIQVWIDFVCPYCLLGGSVIQDAIADLDVGIEIMPFELRPYPTPTLRPEDDYLPRAWKTGVYPTAEAMEIPIRLPSVSPQPYTRDAFIALQYAKDKGRESEFTDAVLRAFFQEDRDIGDHEVLKHLLESMGLGSDGWEGIINNPHYQARHDQALDFAHRAGISAVPSVAVGKRLFSGTPDPQALRNAVLAAMEAA